VRARATVDFAVLVSLHMAHSDSAVETERVWMVERTFSADAPHILVVVYATLDGTRYLQQERAYNRFSGTVPEVTAAIEVPSDDLNAVDEAERRERYATEADRMRDRHEPDDPV
jgi:hypothetical protein